MGAGGTLVESNTPLDHCSNGAYRDRASGFLSFFV